MHPRNKVAASLDVLSKICQARKKAGKTIVLTSGCFDLLHGGHLEYLWDASELGFLVVGVNSDQFVKKIKGDSRPIRDQNDRALTLAGFSAVRMVTIFDCDYELIRAVKPDVYVASPTSHVTIWEDKMRLCVLESIGARVVEIESKRQDSTTKIIKRSIAG
ncbi:MAG: adenylyltransferase/cytidyltransferase family protein [bacterium]